MPRKRNATAYPALVAGLAAVALAAGPARATALAGGGPMQVAALGAVVPAQAQQPPNVESSIAMLHQRLGITPAQEPAFSGFANVMRENARMAPGGPPAANADAVDQLRYAIRYAQQEVDGMRRMLPPLESLYGVLNPQQRAVANQIFRQGPGR